MSDEIQLMENMNLSYNGVSEGGRVNTAPIATAWNLKITSQFSEI